MTQYIVAFIPIDTSDDSADVAKSVLARLADEAGYDSDANPYIPSGPVVVRSLAKPPTEVWHRALDYAADARVSTEESFS